MLCLLFLLINHLKSRIIILENQNEGLMDVMKMIRGNLVNSEKEQKQIKESVQALAKNVAYLNSVVKNIPEKNNIVLEVEDLSFQRDKSTPSNPTWEEESSDEEEEEEETSDEDAGNQGEAEVVNIEWPTREEIEIHKLTTDDEQEAEFQKKLMEMARMHVTSVPMFLHSVDASEAQKMFFMMSMGNHLPYSDGDGRIEVLEEEEETGLGMEPREYEILPTANDDPVVEQLPVQDEDVISEALPETPMPELIDEEGNVVHHTHTFSSEEIEDLNAQINEMIAEVTAEPPITPSQSAVSEVIPEQEPEPQPQPEPETEEVATGKEEKQVDFSKMDVRTLRSLVLAEGKITSERISKMKKAELIRLLSSS